MSRSSYISGPSPIGQVIGALEQSLRDRLLAVILFGSQARGDAGEESDWDLLVIARDLPRRFFDRHLLLGEMLPPAWRGRVSFIAKTPAEFESAVSPVYLDVALDGVVLYDPQGYADEKLTDLREMICQKGLRRERVGEDFFWRWERFPGFGWSLEWRRNQQ